MRLRKLLWMAAAMLTVFTAPAGAGMVLKMNLSQLTDRADAIFRGHVLSAEPGKISIGGGTLPTVTYRLRVDEAFKGKFEAKEDAATEVEITMLGTHKAAVRSGNLMRLSTSLPDVPQLRVGEDYVLFTTAPGKSGLRSPVGLGQGSFRIFLGASKTELAVNELNNLGLFDGGVSARRADGGAEGPVTYTQLAGAILNKLGK
jgi:hypothetical protein